MFIRAFRLQVCDIDVVRRSVQLPGRTGHRVVLDRLFQFVVEPTDIRLLQPRLQGSVQEYAAMRVPVLSVVLSERKRFDSHELRLINTIIILSAITLNRASFSLSLLHNFFFF